MRRPDRQAGFTIVELLIVIIVIAILATISIVSYTGIQGRAKASKAATNAGTVNRVAEAYLQQSNSFPTSVSHFRSGLITLPTDVTILTSGSLTATNGENSILYRYVGTASNATGACIFYWDFAPTTGNPRLSTPTYLGSATSANCSATLGTLPTA